jgi:hypothetical protein
VTDLVERVVRGVDQQPRRRPERHQLEREAREGPDRRVLGPAVPAPRLGQLRRDLGRHLDRSGVGRPRLARLDRRQHDPAMIPQLPAPGPRLRRLLGLRGPLRRRRDSVARPGLGFGGAQREPGGYTVDPEAS